MTANPVFSVTVTTVPAVLTVAGDIDLETADRFRVAAEELLAGAPDDPLVFDLSGVTFIDSSGLAVLAQVVAGGRQVVLRRPPKVVSSILEITGLADLFPVDV